MYSLQDANIFNIAVRGMFDDCQDIVKAVSNDARLQGEVQDRRREFDQLGARRGAGRLLLQGLFRRHAQQRRAGQLHRAVGQLRQHLRRPHRPHDGPADRRLVLATNENDVLDEFFRTGVYRRAPRPRRTSPPARRWIFPRPPTSSASSSTWSAAMPVVVRELWGKVDRGGSFDLWHALFGRSAGVRLCLGRSNHADRLATMRISAGGDDRHAYGRRLKVALELREPGVPMIVLETALPAKFAETVREALGRDPVRPAEDEKHFVLRGRQPPEPTVCGQMPMGRFFADFSINV
jgi:threonine synthase